ncbi:MAG: gliding motility-associated C-terminal domain-containing protein, partial [Bacteroidales bacterium]|nr:gliding motility-associated C-terminal domain-containing protein [Candidatus Colimorpha onthohippi]
IMKNSLSTLPENGLICKGDPAILVAGKADHYKWESFPNDPSLDTNDFTYTATPTVYPTYNTVYAMTPYGSNGCAGEQQIVTLNVYHKPVLKVNRVPLTLDPDNPTMNFVDQSEYSVKSYWIFGDGEHAVGANVSHYFSETQFDTTEVLLQTTNEIGCTMDTTIRIPIQKFASWAPNVFTPNRAENNTFQIRTINNLEYFKVMIFNRRGMLMFESEDPQFVWDGTHNNKDCPQDTYVYICRYRKAGTGETTLKKGVVTILR